MSKLLILATGLAIPFGTPQTDERAFTSSTEILVSFEFVETEQGFDLNALLESGADETVERTRIDHCETIDLDSFDETLFGTPALCDGARYEFDLVGDQVVVAGPGEAQVLRTVATSHVVMNGVPLLVETGAEEQAAGAAAPEPTTGGDDGQGGPAGEPSPSR